MKTLEAEIALNIRFGETDAMGVVWHGNYLKYFEDAREAFGMKHNLNYLDIYKQGFFTPIVHANLEYKSPLYYGDKVKIMIRMIPSRAAKIEFDYEIINIESGKVSAVGKTTQVFLDAQTRNLELIKPVFFQNWEKQAGISV